MARFNAEWALREKKEGWYEPFRQRQGHPEKKVPYASVQADGTLELELWARDDEEVEDAFNEYCEAVQYHPSWCSPCVVSVRTEKGCDWRGQKLQS